MKKPPNRPLQTDWEPNTALLLLPIGDRNGEIASVIINLRIINSK